MHEISYKNYNKKYEDFKKVKDWICDLRVIRNKHKKMQVFFQV